MGDMKIVVGLGNPGDEYVNTRHNMGFKVIDSLSKALEIDVKKRKFGARFGSGEYANKKFILLKPWQFMNRSGQAVATAVGFYKLSIGDLLVITDDMALEPGRIRVRAKGSAGGHNGLKDIIEKLGTEDFARLRVGIGQATVDEAYDYVLSKVPVEQKELIDSVVEQARDAVICWLRNGVEATMNQYNK